MLRFTIRELSLVTAFLGVGCAALKYASDTWITILSAGLLALFMAATIAAVLDRGQWQARAAGFAICVAIYGALLWSARTNAGNDSRELDPYTGGLPTTKLLKPLFEVMVKRTWIELATGKEVPDYDPTKASGMGGGFGGEGGGFGGEGGGGGFGGGVGGRESPPRAKFMALGHLLWAALLGYLGSRFAYAIYLRRSVNEKTEKPSDGAMLDTRSY